MPRSAPTAPDPIGHRQDRRRRRHRCRAVATRRRGIVRGLNSSAGVSAPPSDGGNPYSPSISAVRQQRRSRHGLRANLPIPAGGSAAAPDHEQAVTAPVPERSHRFKVATHQVSCLGYCAFVVPSWVWFAERRNYVEGLTPGEVAMRRGCDLHGRAYSRQPPISLTPCLRRRALTGTSSPSTRCSPPRRPLLRPARALDGGTTHHRLKLRETVRGARTRPTGAESSRRSLLPHQSDARRPSSAPRRGRALHPDANSRRGETGTRATEVREALLTLRSVLDEIRHTPPDASTRSRTRTTLRPHAGHRHGTGGTERSAPPHFALATSGPSTRSGGLGSNASQPRRLV